MQNKKEKKKGERKERKKSKKRWLFGICIIMSGTFFIHPSTIHEWNAKKMNIHESWFEVLKSWLTE
jgi:hypothetical protein